MKPQRARGFTLLEIIIALAIFALVSIAVYTRVGQVVMQTEGLETRTLATWVAQNALTRLRLEQRGVNATPPAAGRQLQEVRMADRLWQISVEISRTADANLLRVDVRVAAGEGADPDAAAVASLTSFLGRY